MQLQQQHSYQTFYKENIQKLNFIQRHDGDDDADRESCQLRKENNIRVSEPLPWSFHSR